MAQYYESNLNAAFVAPDSSTQLKHLNRAAGLNALFSDIEKVYERLNEDKDNG